MFGIFLNTLLVAVGVFVVLELLDIIPFKNKIAGAVLMAIGINLALPPYPDVDLPIFLVYAYMLNINVPMTIEGVQAMLPTLAEMYIVYAAAMIILGIMLFIIGTKISGLRFRRLRKYVKF